ncbi:hypothetical protein QOT17_011525 [Balamuthia mandrillaris]
MAEENSLGLRKGLLATLACGGASAGSLFGMTQLIPHLLYVRDIQSYAMTASVVAVANVILEPVLELFFRPNKLEEKYDTLADKSTASPNSTALNLVRGLGLIALDTAVIYGAGQALFPRFRTEGFAPALIAGAATAGAWLATESFLQSFEPPPPPPAQRLIPPEL